MHSGSEPYENFTQFRTDTPDASSSECIPMC